MASREWCSYTPRIVKRVLLGTFSPMLESIIVDALSNRQDVSLGPAAPAAGAGRCDVDVVLTAAADPDNVDGVLDLLWRWPKSRIVVVARSGRDAVLYELAPRKLALGDLSATTLVEAVCGERR
jgi:hypothetical protein